MNSFVAIIKRVSPITWKVGILVIAMLTIFEVIFAVVSFNKENRYRNLIEDMRIILFVPSNVSLSGSIPNIMEGQFGNIKIIKSRDAVKLLPDILKNGIDKSYIKTLPTVIIITNSNKLFSVKSIDRLKKLRQSGVTINFNENKMNELFHNYNVFHIHFIIILLAIIVAAILCYYIVKLIFKNESGALAVFVWQAGIERSALNGMGNLFFLLITLIATFSGLAIALTSSFFLKLIGKIDVTTITVLLIVILLVNMLLSAAASAGYWKTK